MVFFEIVDRVSNKDMGCFREAIEPIARQAFRRQTQEKETWTPAKASPSVPNSKKDHDLCSSIQNQVIQ